MSIIIHQSFEGEILTLLVLGDHPVKTSAFFRGKGSKIVKICRRLIWMVPSLSLSRNLDEFGCSGKAALNFYIDF